MRKLLLIAALGIAGIISANNVITSKDSTNLEVNSKTEFILGTCVMTFTAYNSAGEALYSWTEYKQADSYEQCLDMGLRRLNELNNTK
ncbi:hypothetical protein CMU93_16665 [Elizabethkingia anophelis]|nr:hypothetical protein [Elizabethkingia anophelis]